MLGSFQKTFNGNSLENAEERIREIMRCEGNSKIVTDFKATDDEVVIRLNGSHSHHIPYNELLNPSPSIYINQEPLTYDNIFEEIMKRLSVKPVLKHQCTNCLAVLELDINKRIFHCPYCNAVYAISEG